MHLPRSENFWQAGPAGPCGLSSEMYLDRGVQFGGPDDLPGDDTERFLEYWNHVFMSYELHEDGSLTDLPSRNIDTGLGLERMAAILQDVPSVYELDIFSPLVGLAEELSGRSYDQDAKTTRAMRIIADHSDGAPARRRGRALERGSRLHPAPDHAASDPAGQGARAGASVPGRFAERVIEMMAGTYPHPFAEQRDTILRWVSDEEESFKRTLDRGTDLLRELISTRRSKGRRGSTRPMRSSSTTPTASRTTSRRSYSPTRACRSTTPASRR